MAAPNGPISNQRIVRVALLTALIVLLVVFFAGVAGIGHRDLRAAANADWRWFQPLLFLSVGAAAMSGAVVAAWRLINRRDPQWALGLLVAAIAFFALMVWPTRWTYPEYGCSIYRIDRMFGTRDFVQPVPACEAEGARSGYDPDGKK